MLDIVVDYILIIKRVLSLKVVQPMLTKNEFVIVCNKYSFTYDSENHTVGKCFWDLKALEQTRIEDREKQIFGRF